MVGGDGDCSASQLPTHAFEQAKSQGWRDCKSQIREYAPTVRALSFSSINPWYSVHAILNPS